MKKTKQNKACQQVTDTAEAKQPKPLHTRSLHYSTLKAKWRH